MKIKPAPTPRAPRTKGTKFVAKKAAKMAAAAKRYAALQADQAAINAYRAIHGPVSDSVARVAIQKQKDDEQAARKEAERLKEEQKARDFVSVALNGPHGPALARFIGKGLPGGPCRVALIVRNWMTVQGIRN